MKDKIIALVVILLITLAGGCFIYSKISEKNDMSEYSAGLKLYRQEEYHSAYKHFGKISLFSNIKTPALFRQARSATLLGDIKGAKRNYNLLLLLYPHSQLYVVSEYNLAMLLYENGDNSARKHFVHIIKYYPDTDYALASEYYVTSIDMKSAQKTKPLEQVVDELKESLRTKHILRLQKGECSVEAGFVWSDLLTNLERVADHCSNISGCVLESVINTMNIHQNQRMLRTAGDEFVLELQKLRKEYKL